MGRPVAQYATIAHFDEIIMRSPSSSADLRSKLGEVVRAARKAKRIKQQSLADDVGLRRESINRIEKGKQMPRPRELAKLVRKLGIEWNEVLDDLYALRPARLDEGTRGRALERLGNDIYERRTAERLSLRMLGRRLRISASQLSRIEGNQLSYSRIFRDHPDDLGRPSEDRRIQITDRRVRAFISNRCS